MSKIKTISLISLIVACYGCNNNPVGITGPAQLFPLAVLSYWKFSIVSMDTSGTITDSSTTTEEILSDTVMNGQTLYEYFSIANAGVYLFPPAPKIYLANESDGVNEYFIVPGVSVGSYLMYKYPAKLNDQYFIGRDTFTV